MLSQANNELLCRSGPGTPFGQLARRYWLPAMRASALPAGGAPKRLRLLNENYVLFRAADGRIACFDEACPHRGVSLTLARSGDNALTCIYHGWKIDVSGRVLDTPNEPPARREKFAASIPVRRLPVREAGGVIWVWPGELPAAPFPAFEFNTLPAGHVLTLRGYARSNWLQGMESALESSHLGILHQSAIRASTVKSVGELQKTLDLVPGFEVEAMPYGLKEAALRTLPDGAQYVRVREVVLPFFNFIPMPAGATGTMFCFVPIDDHHHAQWLFYYRADRPVDPKEVLQPDAGASYDDFAMGVGDAGNGWNQDRAQMEAGHWSGLPGIVPVEDIAVTESMGPIVDRSKEHLGSSDVVVARTRQRLLEMIRDAHPGMGDATEYECIRAIALRCRDIDWRAIDAFAPPPDLATAS